MFSGQSSKTPCPLDSSPASAQLGERLSSKTMCEDNLKKIWVIRCGHLQPKGYETISGGICVDKKGYILTNSLDIKDPNAKLEGRPYRSGWRQLEIFYQKEEFNLTLLRVKEAKEEVKGKVEGKSEFPYFVLEGGVSLRRGTTLFGILHCDSIPFSSEYGFSGRPFKPEKVEFPDIDSEVPDNVDYRKEIRTRPIKFLRLGHVIGRDQEGGESESGESGVKSDDSDSDSDDDVDIDESKEHGSDKDGSDKDESDKDERYDDDVRIHEGGEGDGSDDSDDDAGIHEGGEGDDDAGIHEGGEGDGSDKDESDESDDSDNEFDEFDIRLKTLDARMPLIQAYGLGSSMGCFGCPVFDGKWELVGLYNFNLRMYQYIIPKRFLNLFYIHAMTSDEENVGQEQKGKRKIEDSPSEHMGKGKMEDSPSEHRDHKRCKYAMGIQENVGKKCEKDTVQDFQKIEEVFESKVTEIEGVHSQQTREKIVNLIKHE